jgi:hypothetical protein
MAKNEAALSRQQVFSQLIKSPHGNLNEYLQVGLQAAKEDPDFYAHLVAWNAQKGEIRDAKSALALIALTNPTTPEYVDNAFAVLASLSVRDLIKALRWVEGKPVIQKATGKFQGKAVKVTSEIPSQFPKAKLNKRALKRFIGQYLSNLEANRAEWDRVALQNKQALKYLYRKYRVIPSKRANGVLFGPSAKRPDNPGIPQGSIFEKLPLLKTMDATQAAGTIMAGKVPFLTAGAALHGKIKDPVVIQALIDRMSPAELLNNTKMLEKWGLKENAALRATYEKALEKAKTSKKATASLKADKAASVVTDEKLKAKLTAVSEAKIDQKQIKGNWLVLADKSGSMETSIAVAREVAAILARYAEKVYLVFFDTQPTRYEVTGKTLNEIKTMTAGIRAVGGTSLGVGLNYARVNSLEVDGIAVVTDGGENSAPWFYQELPKLNAALGKDLPVYYYRVRPLNESMNRLIERETFPELMTAASLDFQTFTIDSQNVDYYSLPNLVQSMRVNKYSMMDEIMDTPLRTTEDVFKNLRKYANEEELVNAE